MHLNVCNLLALSTLVAAAPSMQKRDADMESLQGLTHLRNDHSGKELDPEGKYFHESTFHPHYDGRFGSMILPPHIRQRHLRALVRTYLTTMEAIGAETWIMHGSLLGWWWNRKIMPWDSDIDVQVDKRSMDFLASYYNMTVHHFKDVPAGMDDKVEGDDAEGEEREEKTYLLEVNPHYRNASTRDFLNVIDARWIDTSTGLFIDITTLHRNLTAESEGLQGMMMCKDKHSFHRDQIFPLRDSLFEGVPAKIPYSYGELLEEEYGAESLTRADFAQHHFDEQKKEWIPWTEYFGQRYSMEPL
ncbi:hypothetical protein BS50DRAFT_496952 [Corynespora cassiicola Philippines]|uniref:LicD/FKTN/FKRP nucleotidyltransferase domain-containing protein n=1 Tax=Corynespora cassiicola Philippines TaxID=1448308 RepID=A0A2T2NIA7_CORCC|nr:hypothetical protein BS50DRAFT_496952 [Corynespora cassiicola Philippines]